MSELGQPRSTASARRDGSDTDNPEELTGWVGWVLFAGVMLILGGTFQMIAGVVALIDDGYYVVRPSGLVVGVSYTTWGWTHLLLGLVALLAGFSLMKGQTWARVVAIIVAILAAVANFVFIAANPVWGVIQITVNVLVIYAIAAHGEELKLTR